MLAFVVLSVAIAYLYAAFNLPHLDVEDPIGPRLFPKIVGVVAVVAGLLLFAETFSRQKSRLTAAPRPRRPNEHKPMAVLCVLGWTLGFYLLMDSVGYLIGSTVFLLGLTAFFNRGHWPINTAVSLLFTLAVYTTFTKFLGIQLPWGVLYF
ncbi:MAG: tripartite tricarboxylate transporter TctB family protein [Proteobacteria bacterium]|nr:tripartite tricarboxylate transporter TctB family protein [Pseudomonadota bacterium]